MSEEALGESVLPQAPPGYQPIASLENENLVRSLEGKTLGDGEGGEDFLKRMGKITVAQRDEDYDSNLDYYRRCARDIELFLGIQDNFEYGPAQGKPRPCLPLVNKVVTRIYNRMAVVITKMEPIPVPTGSEDIARAERIKKHIEWEKRAKHPEWKSTMCAGLEMMIIVGSMIRYVGWDPVKKRKQIDWASPTDVVVSFSEKDTSPYMEHVGRITRTLRLRRQEIEEYGREGFFEGIDELFDESAAEKPKPIKVSDDRDDPIRKVRYAFERTKESKTTNEKDDANPLYMVYERHSWERLPEGAAPDEATEGRRLRRTAWWVEESTKKVLRAVIMEAEDPLDRLRFKNQMSENQIRFDNLTQEFQGKLQQAQQKMTMLPPETPPEMLPQLPEAPEFEQPKPIRKTPVYNFIHYRFMESPVGFYGLGAGVFASQLNLLANEVIGWHLVQTQLAAIGQTSGYLADEFKTTTKKGKVGVDFGKWIQTDIPSADLKNAFANFQIANPSSNLSQLIEMFDEQAALQMNAHEALSGAPGPSHETASAATMRTQRASENLNMAMENIMEPLAAEFKAYARLNATFMDDNDYYWVTEHDPTRPDKKTQVRKTIGRKDYEIDFDITFDSDVRLMFDEGLGERALQAHQLVMASPFADPNAKLAAEKKALKALGQDELAARYPESIPPPPPPSPKSQEEETAGFLKEEDSPVLPDDDDVVHLTKMEESEQTGIFESMSPTAKQIHERHKRGHQSQAYLKGQKLQQQNNQQEGAFGAASRVLGYPA